MEIGALHTGLVVDRWTVEAPIGEGGMATVWRVRHNKLGTVHALKVLSVANAEIRKRMLLEGEVQARLQHPNVVAVTDVIELNGSPGLVMELVDGPTLDGLMQRHRLTLDQADELARGILAGVAAAHRAGLVHRDLKPANILLKLTPTGFEPKVADFGLAKSVGGETAGHARTRTGTTMGTPHYMSPEQIRDAKSVGPRTDVFALGAILYEMVTGQRAFDGFDLLEIFNAVASGRYAPPRERVPDLPERMERAIVAALQVDAEQRPASVEALEALWSGRELAPDVPRSAFDAGTLRLARSLSSSADVQPAPPVADETRTWGGAVPTISDSSFDRAEPPTGSLAPPAEVRPAADPLTRSRATWAAALGLGGVLALGLVAVGVLALAGAGALWFLRPVEEPEVAVVEPPPPAPEPAPVAAPVAAPAVESPAPPAAAPAPTRVTPAAAPSAPAPVAEPEPVAVVEPAPAPVVAPVAPVAPAQPSAPELTPLLSDPAPSERKKGVANLAKRNDPEADALLVWVVKNDDDGTVKRAAWQVVVDRWDERFGDWDQLQAVVVWQMANGGERDALEAVQAFGRNGESPALLKNGLQHWSPLVRAAAVDAVVQVSPRAPDGFAFAPLLQPLTTDRDPAVVKKANAAITKLQ